MLQQNFRIKLAGTSLFVAFYGTFYTLALLAPAAGLEYDDLAAPQWVQLIPFVCTLAWLYLTRRLLRTLGASDSVAWTICAITAASPTVPYLATHRTAEP